jgi:hypothetical protein
LVQFDTNTVSKEHEKSFWFDHAQLTIPRNALAISYNVTLQIGFEGDKSVSIPIENILNIKPAFEDMQGWVNVSWTGLSNSGGGKTASTILGNTLLRGKTVIFDRGKEEDTTSKSRIGFADASACCRSSSAKDVDILLSVDSVSKAAIQVQDHGGNAVQIFLILLIVLSVIGFFSTLAVFIINHYHEKSKKLKQQDDDAATNTIADDSTVIK